MSGVNFEALGGGFELLPLGGGRF
uniref:ABC transporter ATP-binding protein n=1 Tax=Heterorhabditis bacteriophora TaxID=37862 RepID=A0A1I7XH08_HETBA